MFPRATRSMYIVLIRLEQLLISEGYASIYGYELLKGKGGDVLGTPTVYRILQRLQAAGVIEEAPPRPGCPAKADGAPRTFYRLTATGHLTLLNQIKAWRSRFPRT